MRAMAAASIGFAVPGVAGRRRLTTSLSAGSRSVGAQRTPSRASSSSADSWLRGEVQGPLTPQGRSTSIPCRAMRKRPMSPTRRPCSSRASPRRAWFPQRPWRSRWSASTKAAQRAEPEEQRGVRDALGGTGGADGDADAPRLQPWRRHAAVIADALVLHAAQARRGVEFRRRFDSPAGDRGVGLSQQPQALRLVLPLRHEQTPLRRQATFKDGADGRRRRRQMHQVERALHGAALRDARSAVKPSHWPRQRPALCCAALEERPRCSTRRRRFFASPPCARR